MIYSSVNNDKIRDINKLKQKKYRDQFKLFLVEGKHLVEEAHNSKCLDRVIILDGYDLDYDIEKIYVSDKVMKYLSDLNSFTPYIGICHQNNHDKIGNKVLALDDIQDPGNLGTIIRSCVAFNIDTLLLSKNTVDVFNSKVIRASQGMVFKLNIVIDDLKSVLNKLKLSGYHIIGTDVTNGSKINNFANLNNIVIIMGNEGSGMHSNIRNICDDFTYIDINKNCESLNVGVAASIILYELNKE